MVRHVTLLFSVLLGMLGAYLPSMLRVKDENGILAVLGAFVCGLLGVWLGYKIAKRLEL